MHVVCLCADWCGVCRAWLPVFRDIAAAHPGLRFAWVDVEDEADALGDIEIETFPALLVTAGGEPRFFGAVEPSRHQLERLLQGLSGPGGPTGDPAIRDLARRLAPVWRDLGDVTR